MGMRRRSGGAGPWPAHGAAPHWIFIRFGGLLATESDGNSIARSVDAARDPRVRHTVAGSPDRMWGGVSRCGGLSVRQAGYEPAAGRERAAHRMTIFEGVCHGRSVTEADENAETRKTRDASRVCAGLQERGLRRVSTVPRAPCVFEGVRGLSRC